MAGQAHQITHKGEVIGFTLVRRKRKSITILVYPDRVEVRAPPRIPYSMIEPFIIERAPWIVKKRQEWKTRARPSKAAHSYTTGDQFRVLGRDYRLEVMVAGRSRVEISRGRLRVWTRTPEDTAQIKRLIDGWTRRTAERYYARRLRVLWRLTAGWGKPYPLLKTRTMRTRWGSCTARGSITLNTRLLQAPRPLIDYVILHELAHLREMNHSSRYYAVLAAICPSYKMLRKQLKQYPFPD